VSVEEPPTHARPGHAICPTDTCWTLATVPSSGAATPGPGELCRCVLSVCAYRVKPDF